MRTYLSILTLASLLLALPGRAETRSYAIVVGNNEVPAGEAYTSLARLRYADDDAVRFYQLFSRLSRQVSLLTVLDKDSQRSYPDISNRTRAPTLANLRDQIEAFSKLMQRDHDRGDQASLYLIFSGHGAIGPDAQAFLAFLDGKLTREVLYDQLLAQVPATYIHLIIDACHAGAVVGSRGVFDRELDAKSVRIQENEARQVFDLPDMNRYPHLGIIIASAENQEAHEWSRIQSGVFSHEVLSGLTGPADINRDNRIEYSEIHAFVSAANREVKDPRAIPQVSFQPPAQNQNAALIELGQMRDTAFLEGNPSRLGHFFLELANGQRYLDANLGQMPWARIAVPSGREVFVRTQDQEAAFRLSAGQTAQFAQLQLKQRATSARGSIDLAYRQGLFALAYGVDYYKGFVDSVQSVSVKFGVSRSASELRQSATSPIRRPLAIGLLALAGSAAAASLITGAIALDAKSEFQDTLYQRPGQELSDKYQRYGNAALATGLTGAALGLAAWILWPPGDGPAPIASSHQAGGGLGQMTWTFSWP